MQTLFIQMVLERQVRCTSMKRFRIYEYVGDRGRESISIKDYAFTIAANPMSDRLQKVLEIYERV